MASSRTSQLQASPSLLTPGSRAHKAWVILIPLRFWLVLKPVFIKTILTHLKTPSLVYDGATRPRNLVEYRLVFVGRLGRVVSPIRNSIAAMATLH